MSKFVYIAGIVLFLFCCQSKTQITKIDNSNNHKYHKVILGVDRFLSDSLGIIKNQRVGLITNPSGVNGKLQYTSDLFHNSQEINLVALFGPEHGIRGNAYGGDKVKDAIDPKTGIPLFSLYGKTRKPTEEMLQNVDILIFDIQDIGVRSYTYIYTLAKAMEACAEFNIPFIVLDRPNPLGGLKVEGNILDTTFASFVGMYPLPYLHGMTIGELARYFNNEFNIGCQLKIIPMLHWQRQMVFGDTGLEWVPTSPHVPEWQTVSYLAATGTIGELHSVSIGVGYTLPFKIVGTPWTDGQILSERLNQLNLPGIYFRPHYFKPFYSLFKGELCNGVQLHITNLADFKPYITGIHILYQLSSLYPEHDLFENSDRIKMFNQVMGTDEILNFIKSKKSTVEILEQSWENDLNEFKNKREKYLLY